MVRGKWAFSDGNQMFLLPLKDTAVPHVGDNLPFDEDQGSSGAVATRGVVEGQQQRRCEGVDGRSLEKGPQPQSGTSAASTQRTVHARGGWWQNVGARTSNAPRVARSSHHRSRGGRL